MSKTTVHLLLAMALLAGALLLTAWLCDDAYITFRTVENAATGHGLRWNPVERVQTYTHPLWFGLLTLLRLATGEIYYTALLLSLALSLLTVWLILRRAAGRLPLLWAVVLSLLLSRAFIDYSTSGLEGPLSHLLLTAFFSQFLSLTGDRPPRDRGILLLALTLSGLLLCRLDFLLLAGPAAGWVLWRKPALKAFLAGLVPLAAWEVFSVIYYGFPVANTAYAKLGGAVGLAVRLDSGLTYLGASVRNDPVTGLVLGLSAAAVLAKARRTPLTAVTLGVVLYVGYVWAMGGDFMAGRFLAAPLVMSVLVLTELRLPVRATALAAVALLAAALIAGNSPRKILSPRFGQEAGAFLGESGVADERLFYYPESGLLRRPRGPAPVSHPWVREGLDLKGSGQPAAARTTVGFYGFHAGPDVVIVDLFGICDPLLARLPASPDSTWRPGHILRDLPPGYLESVAGDRGLNGESETARLDRRLRLITRAPLFSPARWRAILAVNLGI